MAYLLLTVLALFVYAVKPSWLMLLWLITVPFLSPVMVLKANIVDFAEAQSFNWFIWGVYNRVFLLIILYELIVRRSHLPIDILSYLFYPWVFLCFFFVIHNLISHFDLKTIYENIVGVIYTISPMAVMLLNKEARPKLKQVYFVVVTIIVVQLIWIPLNMQGIFAYVSKYQEIAVNKDEALLMPGTFTRSNVLADFSSIVFLFIYIDYFLRNKIPAIQFIIITVIIVVLLFFAGSKLPIVATIYGLLTCLVLFSKRRWLVLTLVSVFGLSFFWFLSTTKGNISDNDGVNRVVNGLSSYVQSKNKGKDNKSTFRLTEKLIDKYFYQSPLLGNGYSYRGEDKAYPTDNKAFNLTTIKADATFAYYLVEFGLIGLMLYLFYYFKVIQYAASFIESNANKVVFVVFTFFLLFSLTESGLFDRNNYLYIFIYFFGLQRWYEENEDDIVLCQDSQSS